MNCAKNYFLNTKLLFDRLKRFESEIKILNFSFSLAFIIIQKCWYTYNRSQFLKCLSFIFIEALITFIFKCYNLTIPF